MILTFLVVGVPFVVLGFVIKAASDSVREYSVVYDGAGASQAFEGDCKLLEPGAKSTCTVQITVDADLAPPVYVYYGLTNFYQNHRRYVKSRSDPQLAGTFFSSASGVSTDCDPLTTSPGGKFLHPCGLVANSLFNGEIQKVWESEGSPPPSPPPLPPCIPMHSLTSRHRHVHSFDAWREDAGARHFVGVGSAI